MAKYPTQKISIIPFIYYLVEGIQNKWGYIMAAYGQDPKKLSAWYFNQYKGNTSQYNKAIYWKNHAPIVADCNGLAEGYLTKALGYTVNERARNNYWSWCGKKGKIGTLQKVPGAAVFMANSGTDTMHHVGFLVCPVTRSKPSGDWWVVEARGVMYGVVKTKLSARPWSHWGLMTNFFTQDCTSEEAYDIANGKVVPTNPIVASYGDKNAKVKEIQTYLTELGFPEVGEIDGDFGSLTRAAVRNFQTKYGLSVSGIVYKDTFEKMLYLISGEILSYITITGNSVNIRSGPGTNYSILKVAKLNDIFPKGSGVDQEWNSIQIDQGQYWVSKTYSKEVAQPSEVPKTNILVTGNLVNIRTGPSANSSIFTTAKKGEVFEKGMDTNDEWNNILVGELNYWISKKYSNEQVK